MNRHSSRTLTTVALAGAALLGAHDTAFAYIDPGTGGMLLQLLLGGIAGALVVLKLYWHRARDAFGRLFGASANENKQDSK